MSPYMIILCQNKLDKWILFKGQRTHSTEKPYENDIKIKEISSKENCMVERGKIEMNNSIFNKTYSLYF